MLIFSPKTDLQLRKERKEGVFISIFFTNQERNTKISRTHPRLRVIGKINPGGKGINKKKIEQEEKRGGSTVIRKKMRYQSLDSHQVRYYKPGLMSHFKSIMN
jgi:hypothetical protein